MFMNDPPRVPGRLLSVTEDVRKYPRYLFGTESYLYRGITVVILIYIYLYILMFNVIIMIINLMIIVMCLA